MTSCCADDLRFESVLRAGWGCRGRGRRWRGRRHRRAWRYPWWRQAWWLRGLRRGWRHNWRRRGRVRRAGRQGGQRRRPRPSRRAWWRWWRPGRVEIVPREAGWHVQRHGSLCGGRCEALEETTIRQLPVTPRRGVLNATRALSPAAASQVVLIGVLCSFSPGVKVAALILSSAEAGTPLCAMPRMLR